MPYRNHFHRENDGGSHRRKKPTRRRIEVLVMRGGKVLVAKYYRKTTDEEFYSFPGGGIEDGETGEEAVRRELLEEIGIDVRNVKDLNLVMDFPPPYFITNYKYDKVITEWYKADYAGENDSRLGVANDRSIEHLWLDKKTALRYVNDSLYATGSIRAIERVMP